MMSSLYIGATGLQTHGEGMNVVANNLANVSTVGFKQTMMMYQDLMSQTSMARSNGITNMSQAGMGARVGEMRKIFTQGPFESGSAPTDIGIQGIGFYGVTHNGQTQYTRAGNFRFTAQGDLVDPGGWNLLGHAIKNGTESTTISPISIDFSASARGVWSLAPPARSPPFRIWAVWKIKPMTRTTLSLVWPQPGTAQQPHRLQPAATATGSLSSFSIKMETHKRRMCIMTSPGK